MGFRNQGTFLQHTFDLFTLCFKMVLPNSSPP